MHRPSLWCLGAVARTLQVSRLRRFGLPPHCRNVLAYEQLLLMNPHIGEHHINDSDTSSSQKTLRFSAYFFPNAVHFHAFPTLIPGIFQIDCSSQTESSSSANNAVGFASGSCNNRISVKQLGLCIQRPPDDIDCLSIRRYASPL